MAYDRAKAKAALRKRTEESKNRRDFVSIIKDGVAEWSCGEGKHKMDIIPYITGKNHPELPPGELAYILVVYVHRGIGVNDDTYICMARTYGKPCPICEYRKALEDSDDDNTDQIRALRATQRGIYNVVIYDTDETRRKGVQVWNSSHWLFERILQSINTEESGELITFPDPDDGKRIMFERKGSGETTQYIGHKFVDRNYKISDATLDAAYSLDEIIVMPNYDELNRIFKMGNAAKNEEPEASDPQEMPEEKQPDVREKFKVEQPEDVPMKPNNDAVTDAKLMEMTRRELKAFISENLLDIDADDEAYDKKVDLVKAISAALGSDVEKSTGCPEGGNLGKDYDKFRACDDCENRKACRAAR